METRVAEIAPSIYQLTTYVEPADFSFNQYLIDADEPLLFHCGGRQLFPLVSAAAAKVVAPERLRWISFGHIESDESGSMNDWLALAPHAEVAHGAVAVMVSLNDLADRPPVQLADGDIRELGGKTVRWIDTSHVPHGWESGLIYEETTGTLLCGDLFTRTGAYTPSSDADPVGPASAAEDVFRATALTPSTGSVIRRLAGLGARTLAPMHAPAFAGDVSTVLSQLADDYDRRLDVAMGERQLVSAG